MSVFRNPGKQDLDRGHLRTGLPQQQLNVMQAPVLDEGGADNGRSTKALPGDSTHGITMKNSFLPQSRPARRSLLLRNPRSN